MFLSSVFRECSEHAQQSALNSLKKCSAVIHVDGFAPPLLPVGAPLRKCL